jgi:hypothetical protein
MLHGRSPFPFLAAWAAVLLLLPAGCGGSAGVTTPLGEITIAFTDTATDELDAFEVDVTGVTLTKADDTTVSVLSRTTRIDFTELESVSELIVTAGLTAGAYRSMTVSLDFANAQVWIKGQATPAAILDKDGAAVTGTVDLTVDFPNGIRPQVVANARHLFQLDLNLESAVSVDATANAVTFVPVVAASFDPASPKPLAATGILTSVDAAAGRFVVEKRALNGTALRQFTVAIAANTVFQVDGVVSLGTAGLAALAQQALGTARVWVQGTWDADSSAIGAVAVEAGAGTLGNGQDWVLGHVTARSATAGSDCVLTVLGRSQDVGTGTRRFNTSHQVSVRLGPTRVLRRGAGNALTTDALNVGQLVLAFGDLTGTALDATSTSGTGVVRMLRTSVFGIAAGAPVNNVLTLNVSRFDLRNTAAFDFVVGGITEATPATYTVDVTGLVTTGITTNTRVRALGWANPVGVAGDPNFTAASLVDHTDGGKVLLCQWFPPEAGGIASANATTLTMNVTNADLKVIGDGFAPVTLNDAPAPTVRPLFALGVYLIVQDGALELNFDWTAFANSITTRLAAGGTTFRVSAAGTYAAVQQEFAALFACVIMD